MSKRLARVGVIILALILSTGMIGASSFTKATLDRDTNINVVADDSGVIALIDGDSGDVVQVDSSTGELTIDFTIGSASGVNVNSTYELGNPDWSSDTDEQAFNITNQDGVSHTITLNYTVDSGDGEGDSFDSVKFEVFDSTATNVATASEETDGSFTAASGETFATVVIVNTTVSGVDKNSDLSGTLNVTAT